MKGSATEKSIYAGVKNIGIVCIDNARLSPVATYLLRDLSIRSKKGSVRGIQFDDAGYNRTTNKMADSVKGFLQTKGFGTTDLMEPKRIDKYLLRTKDIIFTMDRFIRRDILYNYFPTTTKEWDSKIIILNEAAGIKEKIRDPKDDYNYDIRQSFILIEKCCEAIIKKIEAAN